jgi:hypothetical protein
MEKGFFGSLFDFDFNSFVTTKLIKVLYLVALGILLIAYVVIFFAATFGEDGNIGVGLVWLLIFGPLFLFFYTLLYRVVFELIIVIFRIFENSRDLLAVTRLANPEASAQVPDTHHSIVPPAGPRPQGWEHGSQGQGEQGQGGQGQASQGGTGDR